MIRGKKLQVIKKIWFLMGQPYGKRMVAQLPEWLAFYAADERNRHKVRELVGKDRFGELGCVRLLNEVYRYHDLLTNHFYASTRLISKHREKSSGKYIRKYDKAQTPYQRLLATLNPELRRYKKLLEQHAGLNPIELSRKVEEAFEAPNSEQGLAILPKMLRCWVTVYFEASGFGDVSF